MHLPPILGLAFYTVFGFELDNKMDRGSDPNSDVLARILSSERMNKDVEMLMNSSYWIEALKNKNAAGISEQLNCNLNFQIFFCL